MQSTLTGLPILNEADDQGVGIRLRREGSSRPPRFVNRTGTPETSLLRVRHVSATQGNEPPATSGVPRARLGTRNCFNGRTTVGLLDSPDPREVAAISLIAENSIFYRHLRWPLKVWHQYCFEFP